MASQGLLALRDAGLERLIKGLTNNSLDVPLYEAELQNKGLAAAVWSAMQPFAELERHTLVRILQAIQAERASRQPPPIELVWTGPETSGSRVRDTFLVMQDLFSRARHSVFIAGYTFDHGDEILAPLHAAMQQYAVSATLVINTEADRTQLPEARVQKVLRRFLEAQWPTSPPYPALYHDPRTSSSKTHASMHAKTVVADARYCLVGSANFTRRGMSRNIEMGVLIDSPALAEQILAHWQALIQAGIIQPAPSYGT